MIKKLTLRRLSLILLSDVPDLYHSSFKIIQRHTVLNTLVRSIFDLRKIGLVNNYSFTRSKLHFKAESHAGQATTRLFV